MPSIKVAPTRANSLTYKQQVGINVTRKRLAIRVKVQAMKELLALVKEA